MATRSTRRSVTDIQPDDKVKAAMNEINAAHREQVAATARGEAEKILKVKQAEAEAEAKALQGQGIANQRKAIIEGLKDSVESREGGGGLHSKRRDDDAGAGHTIISTDERNRMQRPEQSYFDVAFARRVALSKQIPAWHSRRFAASRPRSADFIV
jgi:hypothetical protein